MQIVHVNQLIFVWLARHKSWQNFQENFRFSTLISFNQGFTLLCTRLVKFQVISQVISSKFIQVVKTSFNRATSKVSSI